MYQRDMTQSVPYDDTYYQKYVNYNNTPIAKAINLHRTSITSKYCKTLLDIGIGSGEFIEKSKITVYGFDINKSGIKWLNERNLYKDPYNDNPQVEGYSLWDVLEHMPNPGKLLNRIQNNCYVFVSIPIFTELIKVRQSRHYKPNEHYYYFSNMGLIDYMKNYGLVLLEVNNEESIAGRDNIITYVFQRCLT